jgi:hypothetical protein
LTGGQKEIRLKKEIKRGLQVARTTNRRLHHPRQFVGVMTMHLHPGIMR